MSKKTVLTFEEKHHILEVDGVEYGIPQRTAELEEKIREHDAKLPELTEYEGNMLLLEILFGKEKAQQMFPEGKNTNLDKLAKVSKVAIALYMAEFQNIKNENLKEQMKEIQPLLKQVETVANIAQKSDIVSDQRRRKKK